MKKPLVLILFLLTLGSADGNSTERQPIKLMTVDSQTVEVSVEEIQKALAKDLRLKTGVTGEYVFAGQKRLIVRDLGVLTLAGSASVAAEQQQAKLVCALFDMDYKAMAYINAEEESKLYRLYPYSPIVRLNPDGTIKENVSEKGNYIKSIECTK